MISREVWTETGIPMNKRDTDAMSFDPSTESSGSQRKSAATYRRRRTAAIAIVASMLGGGFYLPIFSGVAGAVPLISEPPLTGAIVSFPARDFISADGWSAYPFVNVDVIRDGVVVGFAHDLIPDDGGVEVNHPGGACWNTVTPNIVGGDIVRLTGLDAAHVPLAIDQTTTANVTVTETVHQTGPGRVEMSGTALKGNGDGMRASELEAGALSGAAARFTGGLHANMRLLIAGPLDTLATTGTQLTADDAGNWTAVWTELNAVDMELALASESRIVWLGGGTGSTIFEVADGIAPGPFSAACNAPLAGPIVSTSSTTIDLPATTVTAPLTTSAASLLLVTNAGFGTDASTELIVSSVRAIGPDADQFVVTNTCSGTPVVVGGTCDVSVRFRPTTITPSQLKTATIAILSNAGNSTVSVRATGYALTAGQSVAVLIAKPANLDFGTRAVANTSPAQSVVIKNIGNLDAEVSATTITGAADFTIASQNCTTGAIAPLATCAIDVTFAPAAQTARAATLNIASNSTALSVGLAGSGLDTANIVPFPHLPIELGTFMDRDFVSVGGFDAGELLTIQIIRHGVVVGSAFNVLAGNDGVAEVNHPGGSCWEGVTPDIRAGDAVRVTRADGRAYEMLNADVKVTQKATAITPESFIVAEKGYARDLATGGPLPLGSIEARLIASTRNPFAINGRRALTSADAPTRSTLTFDPIDPITNPDGVNWTATWDFTDSPDPAADVALAGSEQNRLLWLGRDPVALAEISFAEDAPGNANGPFSGACGVAEGPTPGIAVMTPSSTFPALTEGDTGDRTYKVRNIGTAPLEISSIAFAGSNPGDFSLVGDVPAPIAAGSSATFTVRFSPTTVTGRGARSAIIQINDNAVGSPHTARATGLAVLTASASALMTPAALTFGDTQVGLTAATQSITVLNEGGADLSFSSFAVANTTVGTTAVDFSIVNDTEDGHCNSTQSIPADGTCLIEVAFTPSAVNNRAATLTIESNDPLGAKAATLTGTSSISAEGAFDPPRLPHAISVFPVRDYVAAAGFSPDEVVVIEAWRNGVMIGQSDALSPREGGLVEVNHVITTGCWETATPDLQAGDIVRAVARLQADETGAIVSMDQIHVQGIEVNMGVTQTAPDTVVFTGTAVDTFTGLPLAAAEFQPRITTKTINNFSTSGRQDLRAGAGGEGSITMTGKHWTATFSGLTAADINFAVNGDEKALWLGRVPATLNEQSHTEWGEIPGPAGACPVAGNRPDLARIPRPTLAPATLNTGYSGSLITGTASANNVSTFTNTGTVALTGISVGTVDGLNPGDFTRTTNCPDTLNAGESCTVTVSFKATADGLRFASIPISHSGQNGVTHMVVSGVGVGAPTFTAIAPAIAGRGATVTITGTQLTSTIGVTFEALGQAAQAAASFTVIDDTTITAVIPENLSGTTLAPLATAVAVTTRGGTATLAGGVGGLTVNGTPPTITLRTPISGVAGTTVTITGTGFIVGATTVTFNGVVAALAATPAASTTSITVVVPAEANTTGAAITDAELRVITINGGTSTTFTVGSSPRLTGFSAAATKPGIAVTLTGTGFTAASTVTFTTATNGTVAAAVAAATRTSTSLRVTVPATAVQGLVRVATTGFITSSLEFMVNRAPTITSFTPTTGGLAATIVITGNNFRGTTSVSIGGTSVPMFVVNSPTRITVTGLGVRSATGTISIAAFGRGTSAARFTVVQPPTIITFTPTTARRGLNRVTVTGINFVAGSTVSLVQGGVVRAQTATIVSATSITFTPSIATPAGLYNIRVTNAAGSATSVGNLRVNL